MPLDRSLLKVLSWVIGTLLLVAAALIAFSFTPAERHKRLRQRDIDPILSVGGIETDQDVSVVYSYDGPSDIFGDYYAYSCLQLARFTGERNRDAWQIGPEANPIIGGVVNTAASLGKVGNCFSAQGKPNTESVVAYVVSVRLAGRNTLNGAKVLLFESSTRRLLFVDWNLLGLKVTANQSFERTPGGPVTTLAEQPARQVLGAAQLNR